MYLDHKHKNTMRIYTTPMHVNILNVILAQDASDPFKIDVRRRKGNTKMKGRKVQVGVY